VFPPWVLLLHWLAVLFGGAAFLIGYAMRARATPVVMTIAYATMAGVCALETFGYLQHAGRFRDIAVRRTASLRSPMALEYAAYLWSRCCSNCPRCRLDSQMLKQAFTTSCGLRIPGAKMLPYFATRRHPQ
jgi:hypothetical protein